MDSRPGYVSDDELLTRLATSFAVEETEPDASSLRHLSLAVAEMRRPVTTVTTTQPSRRRVGRLSLPRRLSPVATAGALVGALAMGTGISYAVGVPIPSAVRSVARSVGLAPTPTTLSPAVSAAQQAESTLHEALTNPSSSNAALSATRRTSRTSWQRWATTIRPRHNGSATTGTIFWCRPARRWVGQEATAHPTKAVAPPLRPEAPAHPGEIAAAHAGAAAPGPVRWADRPRAPTRRPHRARTTAGRAIRTAARVRAATRLVPPMTAVGAARRRRARRCRPVAHKGAPRAVAHRGKARGTTTAREGPRLTHRAHPVVGRPPVEATRRPGNLQADQGLTERPGAPPRGGQGNHVPVPGSGPTARATDPKTSRGDEQGLGDVSRRKLSSRIGRVPAAAAGGRGASPHPDPTRPTAQDHALQGVGPAFSGAHAHHGLHRDDPDLAITDLPGGG